MQKHKRRITRWLGMCGCYGAILAASLLGWVYTALPDTIYLPQGEQVQFARMPYITVQQAAGAADAALPRQTGSYNTTLSLGGVLPVKTVRAVVTDRPVLLVCGTPFGIKMFSDGALVVAFSDVSTDRGSANPAKEAGLKLGDRIIRVGQTETTSNEQLAAAIQAADGACVTVTFRRDGAEQTTEMTPVRDSSGRWKTGMWVRDSSAGVGTLTFVDERTGVFGGLGHSISDSDTGQRIALRTGEIVSCTIIGCEKGAVGAPGQLKGRFSGGLAIGTIRSNNAFGVYGTTRTRFSGKSMEVAFAQEVQTGPAQILSTVTGDAPVSYDVEIERLHYTNQQGKHNLLLRVTDPRLLETTGGIVQGMSGSPIIQNGRIVGAVTHVLVNDPTKGYGIFIENMLDAAA